MPVELVQIEKVKEETLEALKAEVASLWRHWQARVEVVKPVDHVLHSKIMTTALIQVAATAAVDCGMDEVQFLAVCKSSFAGALARAPRWG